MTIYTFGNFWLLFLLFGYFLAKNFRTLGQMAQKCSETCVFFKNYPFDYFSPILATFGYFWPVFGDFFNFLATFQQKIFAHWAKQLKNVQKPAYFSKNILLTTFCNFWLLFADFFNFLAKIFRKLLFSSKKSQNFAHTGPKLLKMFKKF